MEARYVPKSIGAWDCALAHLAIIKKTNIAGYIAGQAVLEVCPIQIAAVFQPAVCMVADIRIMATDWTIDIKRGTCLCEEDQRKQHEGSFHDRFLYIDIYEATCWEKL
jgi:hypothetical protein